MSDEAFSSQMVESLGFGDLEFEEFSVSEFFVDAVLFQFQFLTGQISLSLLLSLHVFKILPSIFLQLILQLVELMLQLLFPILWNLFNNSQPILSPGHFTASGFVGHPFGAWSASSRWDWHLRDALELASPIPDSAPQDLKLRPLDIRFHHHHSISDATRPNWVLMQSQSILPAYLKVLRQKRVLLNLFSQS